MDIQDEIKLRQAQLEEQKKLAQRKVAAATSNAEKYIPQIVTEIRNSAIRRAAVANTNKQIYRRRGLLGKTKYIKIEYKLSQDDSDLKLQWYLALYRADRTIICKKLASAINAAGLCNTHISYYEPKHYFYISTELNIT